MAEKTTKTTKTSETAIKEDTSKRTEPVVENPSETVNPSIVGALAEQIRQLQAQIEQLKSQSSAPVQEIKTSDPFYTPSVKIIHLVQRDVKLKTLIVLSNITIAMRDFGEERTLTLQQFEELVGKYRRWFDLGIIGVSADCENVAARYGLSTTKNYPITSEFLRNIENIDMAKIENAFANLPKAGKQSIIGLWQRKIIEGDPKFKDIRKIEVLNRLSDGALVQTIAEINAESNKNK